MVVLAVAVLLAAAVPVRNHELVSVPHPAAGSPAVGTDILPLPGNASPTELAAASEVRLTLTLEPSNASRMGALLAAVENPFSPEYRDFLTVPQFVREFGPNRSTIRSVEATLDSVGARAVTVAPGGAGVGALVTAAGIRELLGVTLYGYSTPSGPPIYSALGAVRLPASLRSAVVGIGGLSDVARAGIALAAGDGVAGTAARGPLFVQSNDSTTDWYMGSDFAQAYRATDLWPGTATVTDPTYPTQVAIATLLAGGYDSDNSTLLPPWDPAVVDQYFHDTLAPAWPVSNVTGVPVTLPGGTSPPLPGSFHGVNDSTGDETENSLDLEMAGSLAPGAPLYNFYFPGDALESGSPLGDLADDLADDLGAALNYSYAPAHLAVVSVSAGLPDLNDSLWNAYLAEAALTGVTVVASSGDDGDYPEFLGGGSDGQWPVWPSTATFDTYGSLSAGGTTVTLGGEPTSTFDGVQLNASYDSTVTNVTAQSVWFDRSLGAGSEGGASTVYPEPSWQFHSAAQPAIANATAEQGASRLGRAVPDLAFPANNTVVYDYANASGSVFAQVLEGTSVAAPILAGLIADAVAVRSAEAGVFSPLGFVDPELYRIASYYARFPGPTDPFMDVTQGSNFLFAALPGWDAATGWGGLNVSLFLRADANESIRDYVYTGPTPGLPTHPASPLRAVIEAAVAVGIVASVVALIAVVLRRSKRTEPPAPPPAWGPPPAAATGPMPPGPYVPAPPGTVPCPICGAPRTPGPVRCFRCGAA